jgi:hypothetical protein
MQLPESNRFAKMPVAVFAIAASVLLLLVLNPLVLSLISRMNPLKAAYVIFFDLSVAIFGIILPAIAVARRNRFLLVTAIILLGFEPLFLAAAEVVIGHVRSEAQRSEMLEKSAERTPVLAAHPLLGWWHGANMKIAHSKPEFEASYTTDDKGRRIIRQAPAARSIHFFGDSYIFGWGVNNADAALQLLAARPGVSGRFQIRNYGVAGYGLEHTFQRLRNSLGEIQPGDSVVFTFIAHDLRRSLHEKNWVCNLSWYYIMSLETFPVFRNGNWENATLSNECSYIGSRLAFSNLPIGRLYGRFYEWYHYDPRRLETNAALIVQQAEALTIGQKAKFIAILFPELGECSARKQSVNLSTFSTEVNTLLEFCPESVELTKKLYYDDDHLNVLGNAWSANSIEAILKRRGVL